MSQLAQRVEKISDLDGATAADYGVVLRSYPGVESDRLLDVTKEQVDALIALAVKDALVVEVRNPNTTVQHVQVPVAAVKKWVGDDKVVQNAAHLKGRKPGYSPNGH